MPFKAFGEKWKKAVEEKNSILCAGLDPAEFEMGRGPKGLPQGVNKREWSVEYVEKVAPYCAAVKPNLRYWLNKGDMEALEEIVKLAHEEGLVVIEDSKLADIGSTNDAGVYYAAKKGFDAVTCAPFAGNLKEIVEQGRRWEIGIISMVLMSNKEYEKEKNKLVPITLEEAEEYSQLGEYMPIRKIDNEFYLPQYIHLSWIAKKHGVDGIVIGAPSETNHIREEEIKNVRNCVGNDMIVLQPGVGEQRGKADAIFKYFDPDKVIVNVGRAMMFPKEGKTSEEIARYYQNMLNELRKKYRK